MGMRLNNKEESAAGTESALTGTQRRKKILALMRQTSHPLSGGALGRETGVSRQVVVQDIALMRAAGADIVSTNRGYLLVEGDLCRRVFKVNHTDEQIEDELCTIVDLGGSVEDVFVWHKVYGKIQGDLRIDSRRRVEEFMEGIRSGKSSPLKNVTSGYHYHTVEARSPEVLDEIQNMLREKGYLISTSDAPTYYEPKKYNQ